MRAHLSWKDERQVVREFHLITIKPILFIANVNEDGFENNPYLDAVSEIAANEGAEELFRSVLNWKQRFRSWMRKIRPSSWKVLAWKSRVEPGDSCGL